MNLADAIFIILATIVLLGAAIAVFPRNVFYNALGMGLSFFGVAGLFIYLRAEFLAAMQVIIYIGAIAIAIIFAIMLSRPMWLPQEKPPLWRTLRSGALAVLIFAGVSRILLGAPWRTGSGGAGPAVGDIGNSLLGKFVLPFELISLVLLIVIIGAILISQRGDQS